MTTQGVNGLITVLNTLANEEPNSEKAKSALEQHEVLIGELVKSVSRVGRDSSKNEVDALFTNVRRAIEESQKALEKLKLTLSQNVKEDAAKSSRVRQLAFKVIKHPIVLATSANTKEINSRDISVKRRMEELKACADKIEARRQKLDAMSKELKHASVEVSGSRDGVSAMSYGELQKSTASFFQGAEFFVDGQKQDNLHGLFTALATFTAEPELDVTARVKMFSDPSESLSLEGQQRDLEILKFASKEAFDALNASLSKHCLQHTGVVSVARGKFEEVRVAKNHETVVISSKARIDLCRVAGDKPMASVDAVMETTIINGKPTTKFIFKEVVVSPNATLIDMKNMANAFPSKKPAVVKAVESAA